MTPITLKIERQLIDPEWDDLDNYINPERVIETHPNMGAAHDRVAAIAGLWNGTYRNGGSGEILIDGQEQGEIAGSILMSFLLVNHP